MSESPAPPASLEEPSRDELELRIDGLVDDDLNRGMTFFRGRLGASESAWLHGCLRCGLCAEACHYALASGEPEDLPGRKLAAVTSAARARTLAGAMFAGMVGARDFDRAAVRDWMDVAYGRCTLCGRCTLRCPVGIDVAALLRNARGTLGVMGLTPPELAAPVTRARETGNGAGLTQEAFREAVARVEARLREATGDPQATIPVDKTGARILFLLDPRSLEDGLLAAARIFHAAGEDWTLSSTHWDATNPAHATGSPKDGGAIASAVAQALQRLKAQVLVLDETGHGFLCARWEAPEWLQKSPTYAVRSILELIDAYLEQGRLSLATPDPRRVTLHDPCTLVRQAGIYHPQRRILGRLGFQLMEMPNRGEASHCCGAGGGQLLLDRYRDRRLKAGSAKLGDIRTTGARTVVAPCRDCQEQLVQLAAHHGADLEVRGIVELVAAVLRA